MVPRAIELRPVRNVVRKIAVRAVQNVSHEYRTFVGHLVINTAEEVVLRADIRVIDQGLSRPRCRSIRAEKLRAIVRQRIKSHCVSYRLPHRRVRIFRYRRTAGTSCSGCQELMCTRVRYGYDIRYDLLLAQAFIVEEEERFVLLDRSAEAGAK